MSFNPNGGSGSSSGASSSAAGVVTHKNPQDFTVAYTSNVTLTVSSAPFTVENASCFVAYIYYKPTAGTWQAPLVNGVNGVSITAAANVITVAGAGTPFASGDIYQVGIVYQDKAYTAATDSQDVSEIAGLDTKYSLESLVDTTNVAAAAQTYPSAAGWTNDGKIHLTLTGKYIDAHAVSTSFVVQGTNDEDATPANRDWVNLVGYVSGLTGTWNVAENTYTSSLVTAIAQTGTFAWDFEGIRYKYVRVVMTPGDATNTAIIKSYRTAI